MRGDVSQLNEGIGRSSDVADDAANGDDGHIGLQTGAPVDVRLAVALGRLAAEAGAIGKGLKHLMIKIFKF